MSLINKNKLLIVVILIFLLGLYNDIVNYDDPSTGGFVAFSAFVLIGWFFSFLDDHKKLKLQNDKLKKENAELRNHKKES